MISPQPNKSLLLLFETDSVAADLNSLRKSVAAEFGGGSALDLPLHLTLFKWRATQLSLDLASRLADVSADISVRLGDLVLSPTHDAIWYVAASSELPGLRRRATDMLVRYSVAGFRRKLSPHLTVAYHDYTREELNRIYRFVLDGDRSVEGSLQGRRLVIAWTDPNGTWHLNPDCGESH
jgi:hypothetical protein